MNIHDATEIAFKNGYNKAVNENRTRFITLPQDKYPKPTEEDILKGIAEMSYQSPIEIMYQGFKTKLEGDVMSAIHSYGVNVDKDELIKALEYDRDQYRKGYADGCRGRLDSIRADVAREIFEEIERLCDAHLYWNNCSIIQRDDIAELKKKYTEDKNE